MKFLIVAVIEAEPDWDDDSGMNRIQSALEDSGVDHVEDIIVGNVISADAEKLRLGATDSAFDAARGALVAPRDGVA